MTVFAPGRIGRRADATDARTRARVGQVRREEEARGNTEHPAHLSAENTLFVDVGSDQGTAAAHLAHAAVSLGPGAAPFAPPGASPLAPQLSAMTSPLYIHCYTGVLASYGQNFDNSEATRPDFGPGPAPGPKTAGLLDLGVEGYASLLQGLCSTHKAEVDLIDPSWRSIKYTPKQSKPRERKGSMAADPQGGVPGLGVDPRARGTYGQGGGQGKARAPTMAGRLAAGPEMQPRGRGKEVAFAYDSATGGVRDVGRQRMCPVFLELHGHLKMTVLALEPTMPARDVVAMLFGRNAGPLGGEDPEVSGEPLPPFSVSCTPFVSRPLARFSHPPSDPSSAHAHARTVSLPLLPAPHLSTRTHAPRCIPFPALGAS